jgi:multiple sugar transport system substrate-binding protein
MEPGWYVPFTTIWFGGSVWDARSHRIDLLSPPVVAAFDWIGSYTARLGQAALGQFQAGFGNFNSPQNAFLAGEVAMVQQGPWMANYIEELNPSMNRWKMSKADERRLPYDQRKQNYEWGVAPFPSAVPGATDVSYVAFDALVIPRGCPHKKEAFEFIAFVNRQDEMEKLCSLHCKNSPLAKVSQSFIDNHPNPYIDVFERLARSPNARPTPQCPISREVVDELNVVALDVSSGQATARQALTAAQHHIDAIWASYQARQKLRAAKEGG